MRAWTHLSHTQVELRRSHLLAGITIPQAKSSCGVVWEAQTTVNGPLLILQRSTPGTAAKSGPFIDLGMPVPGIDAILATGI
jgi:hypothetical protein